MRDGIDSFLADLEAELRKRGRFDPRTLAEARDHLLSAAEAAEGTGCSRAEAERRAVERFGSIAQFVAAASRLPMRGRILRVAAQLLCAINIGQAIYLMHWYPEEISQWIVFPALIIALNLFMLGFLRSRGAWMRTAGRRVLIPVSIAFGLLFLVWAGFDIRFLLGDPHWRATPVMVDFASNMVMVAQGAAVLSLARAPVIA